MNIQLKGNEQLTELLNEWYLQIRARNRENSIRLKKEIEQQLHNLIGDQNLLFYYSLLDFRFNYLLNNQNLSSLFILIEEICYKSNSSYSTSNNNK